MQKGVLFMQRELGQLLNFNLVRLSKQQVRKGDRERVRKGEGAREERSESATFVKYKLFPEIKKKHT